MNLQDEDAKMMMIKSTLLEPREQAKDSIQRLRIQIYIFFIYSSVYAFGLLANQRIFIIYLCVPTAAATVTTNNNSNRLTIYMIYLVHDYQFF